MEFDPAAIQWLMRQPLALPDARLSKEGSTLLFESSGCIAKLHKVGRHVASTWPVEELKKGSSGRKAVALNRLSGRHG